MFLAQLPAQLGPAYSSGFGLNATTLERSPDSLKPHIHTELFSLLNSYLSFTVLNTMCNYRCVYFLVYNLLLNREIKCPKGKEHASSFMLVPAHSRHTQKICGKMKATQGPRTGGTSHHC